MFEQKVAPGWRLTLSALTALVAVGCGGDGGSGKDGPGDGEPPDLVDEPGDADGDWVDLVGCSVAVEDGWVQVTLQAADPLPADVPIDRPGTEGDVQYVFQAAFDLGDGPDECDLGPVAGAELLVSAEHISLGTGEAIAPLADALVTATWSHTGGCSFTRSRVGQGTVSVEGDTLVFGSPVDEEVPVDTPVVCYTQRDEPRSIDVVE